MLYVDASALGAAYFPDERSHAELNRQVFATLDQRQALAARSLGLDVHPIAAP